MADVTNAPTIQDMYITRGRTFVMDGVVSFIPDEGSIEAATLTFLVYPDLNNWADDSPMEDDQALLTVTSPTKLLVTGASAYTLSLDGSEFTDTSVFPYSDVRPYSIYATYPSSASYELQRGLLFLGEN